MGSGLSLLVTCPYTLSFLSSQDTGQRQAGVLGQVWFFNFPTKLRSKLVLQKASLYFVATGM